MDFFENKFDSKEEKEKALSDITSRKKGIKPTITDMGRGIRFTDDVLVNAVLDEGLIGCLSGAIPGAPVMNRILEAKGDQQKTREILRELRDENSEVYEVLMETLKNKRAVLDNMPQRIALKEDLNEADLIHQIRQVRNAHPHEIVGLNLMHAVPDWTRLLKVAGETRVQTEKAGEVQGIDIVYVGAGIPKDLPKAMEAFPEMHYVPIVSSARVVKIMMRAAKKGRKPFAFYMEHPGFAAGHLGGDGEETDSFKKILDEIKKEAPETPIIVGGGIAYREDIDSAIAQGADGVGIGTRTLLTQESGMHNENIKDCLNPDYPIVVTKNSPTGLSSRSVKTPGFEAAVRDKDIQAWGRKNCISCIGYDKLCQFFKKKNPDSYCIADRLVKGLIGKDSALLFASERLQDMRRDSLYQRDGQLYVPTIKESIEWILNPENEPQKV